MKETKRVSPDVIFNKLGETRFDDWSNLPLKVLGSRKNTFKLSPERYDRNKYLGRQIWRLLKEYLNHPDVNIYADTATWDENVDEPEFIPWDKPFRLSCSSDLLLIEKGSGHGKKLVKREFKVEMPKGANPLVFKKSELELFDANVPESVLGKYRSILVSEAIIKYLIKNSKPYKQDDLLFLLEDEFYNAYPKSIRFDRSMVRENIKRMLSVWDQIEK